MKSVDIRRTDPAGMATLGVTATAETATARMILQCCSEPTLSTAAFTSR